MRSGQDFIDRLYLSDGTVEGTEPLSEWDGEAPIDVLGVTATQNRVYLLATTPTSGVELFAID